MLHYARAILALLVVLYGTNRPQAALAAVCDTACQVAQRAALVDLYTHTNAATWNISDGWLGDKALSNSLPTHCGWFGVACCLNGRLDTRDFPSTEVVPCQSPGGVAAILLVKNNLSGAMVDVDWAALAPSLQYIDLSGNAITGTIPTSISTMYHLTYLRLEHNKLAGSIPPAIFQMSNLSTIILTANELTGKLSSFSMLVNLAVFKAGDNRLTGEIPADWTMSKMLQVFALEFNQMSGTIPPPAPVNLYGASHSGMQIKLRNNSFYGRLPGEFANLPIGILDVGSNQITGNLSVIESMPLGTEFRFDGNQMTGSIPQISSNVQVLDLQSNNLTGLVPTFRGTAMVELRTSFNPQLEGPWQADTFVPYLLFFRIHNTSMRQSLPSQQNNLGENLPPSLRFDRQSGLVSSQDIENLECYNVIANPKYFFNLKIALVDSYYFDYQYCKCRAGFNFKRLLDNHAQCVPAHTVNVGVLVPAVVFGVVALGLVLLVGTLFLRYKLLPAAAAHHKMKGPPGDGKPATLVLTDVESSTELWEWDRVTMMEAISVHDRCMRTHLTDYSGYEVSTEGDAFLLVFHDPADAVAYTIATQQALLAARWPFKLEEHVKSCLRLKNPMSMQGTDNVYAVRAAGLDHDDQAASDSGMSDADGRHRHSGHQQNTWLSLGQIDPKDIMHWGLNVRMAVATGTAENIKVNAASKRREYHGKLKTLVEALSAVPHGGQIIIDSATFTGINTHLTDILKVVPASPDYAKMNKYRRESPAFVDVAEAEDTTATPQVNSAANLQQTSLRREEDDTSSLILALLGPSHRNDIVIVRPGTNDYDSGSNTTSGHTTRTTEELAGLPTASVRSFHDEAFDTQHRLSLRGLLPHGDNGARTKYLQRWGSAGAQHVQTTLTTWWQSCMRHLGLQHEATAGHVSAGEGIMVVDMGMHVLPSIHGAHVLIQIAVPGLEERVRFAAPLRSIPVSPGYLDAPGALESPLTDSLFDRMPLKPVTLVFCSIDGLQAMKDTNLVAAELALILYQDYIRRWLLKMSGYECQQADGEFMLAFASPVNAVQFCLLVQDAMLQGSWSRDILALPNCGAAGGSNNEILWYGPRVRMGMYEGEPTRVVPHTTSGRADYFGPLVNRAARFCYGAAHGGQIMMPLPLAQRIVHEWASEHFDLHDQLAEVPVFCSTRPHDGLLTAQHATRAMNSIEAPHLWRRASDPRRDHGLWPDGRTSMQATKSDELLEPDATLKSGFLQYRSLTPPQALETVEAAPSPAAYLRAQGSADEQNGLISSRLAPARGLRPAPSSRFVHTGPRRNSIERAATRMDPQSAVRSNPAIKLSHPLAVAQPTALHSIEPLLGTAPTPFKQSCVEPAAATVLYSAEIPSKALDRARPAVSNQPLRKRRARSAASYTSYVELPGPTHASPISEAAQQASETSPKGSPHRSHSYDLAADAKDIERAPLDYPLTGTGPRRSSAPSISAVNNGIEIDWGTGGAGGSSTRNSTLMADGVKQRSWRESQPNSRRMSRSRQSNTSDGSRLAETELPPMFEVEVHHCGLYHFKGLAELQNVIQMNSVQLAGRTFPMQMPTKKGKLVAPARGVQCFLTIK